jgi:cytochrome c oxidase subunit 3
MAEAKTLDECLPVQGRGQVGTAWWGMLCLLATEGILFVYLIFSYAYLGIQNRPDSFPLGGPPAMDLSLPATILLLASSGTAEWSKRRARGGDLRGSKAALAVTLLLGIAFVTLSGIEWSTRPFALGSNAYSSIYYVLTGTHLAHVVIGLIALAILLGWSLAGKVHAGHDQHRTLVTLYWHFVDIVWLFVFATVYLSPRLL